MILNKNFNSKYDSIVYKLDDIITNYDITGEDFGNQDRNSLKLFDVDGRVLNVKSFKIPNLINQVAYKFFRKSKAQRSFEYANKLIKLGIYTPQPIAYYEFTSSFLFKRSFYLSEHLKYDLTFRELTTDFKIKDHEAILRAFTRFTHTLHQKGVHFLDHSPGNTLINRKTDGYDFYLVDLNRMEFGELDFDKRMKNFSKLTIHKFMIELMANEYAKCTGEDESEIFDRIWHYTKVFQERYHRKVRMKGILKKI